MINKRNVSWIRRTAFQFEVATEALLIAINGKFTPL